MRIFGKKKEEKRYDNVSFSKAEGKKANSIQILGSGCEKCRVLERETKKAVKELGLHWEVGHVTDFVEIASYGVMSTPALVLNGRVVSSGRILNAEEIKCILKESQFSS